MTTYTECRDAIVTTLNASWVSAYPGVPAFYDNAETVDLDSIDEFLSCSIEFMDGEQGDIGPTPFIRTHGMVSITLAVEQSAGYKTTLSRADFLRELFRFKKINGVTFRAPHLLPPTEDRGWFLSELVIPFFFDG